MQESTRALVSRAQQRDPAALEQLVAAALPGLHSWLRLRCGAQIKRQESVSDLVQSVAREALQDLDRFEWRGEAAFRHWLYLRAQNKIVDRARRIGAQKRDPAREERLQQQSGEFLLEAGILSPSQDASSKESIAQIEQAFAQLPERYREAVSMRRLCGMDYEQVAEALGVTVENARSIVHRGLSRLALLLEGEVS